MADASLVIAPQFARFQTNAGLLVQCLMDRLIVQSADENQLARIVDIPGRAMNSMNDTPSRCSGSTSIFAVRFLESTCRVSWAV